MANTISTLNFLITGESEDLLRDFDNVADRVWSLGNRIEQTGQMTQGFTMATGRAQRGLLEASRGVEDFAVVLAGGGGLNRALMATMNNINQLAATVLPAGKAAFVGLGVVVLTTVIPAIYRFATGAAEAEKRLEDLRKQLADWLPDAIKKSADAAGFLGEQLAFKRMIEGIDTVEGANAALEKHADAWQTANGAIAVYGDTITKASAALDEMQGRAVFEQDNEELKAQIDTQKKYIESLKESYQDAVGEMEQAGRASAEIRSKLPELELAAQTKAARESIEVESKRLDVFRKMAEKKHADRDRLQTTLLADTDPVGAQLSEIENTLRGREQEIASLFAGDPETIKELTRQAYGAALDDLNEMAQQDAKKNSQRRDLGGPVAALQGSEAAFSLMQRAIRRGRDPGEETAENTEEANERLERIGRVLEEIQRDGAEFTKVTI